MGKLRKQEIEKLIADIESRLASIARDEALAGRVMRGDTIAAQRVAQRAEKLKAAESRLAAELDRLRADAAAREAQLTAKLTAELDRLRADAAAREAQLTAQLTAKLDRALADAAAREAQLTTKLDRLRADAAAREAQLAEATTVDLSAVLARKADLQAELERLRGALPWAENISALELRLKNGRRGRPAGDERTKTARDAHFWTLVRKDADGCWTWLGNTSYFPHRGLNTAKQVAFLLVRGRPPVGRLVAACQCLNPDHNTEEC